MSIGRGIGEKMGKSVWMGKMESLKEGLKMRDWRDGGKRVD
jgi:hypothetical protein